MRFSIRSLTVIRAAAHRAARLPAPSPGTPPSRLAHCLGYHLPLSRRNHSNVPEQLKEKYAEQLLQKAKAEGHASVDELLAKHKERQRQRDLELKKQSAQQEAVSAPESVDKAAPTPSADTTARPKAAGAASTSNGNQLIKPLDQILRLDRIVDQDIETISKLWTKYHSIKNHLSAVIPTESYQKLYKRSQLYPRFIFPVPQSEGIEVYYCQFHFHQCYFTPLLEYKTHGESAKPYLTLTHYSDLKDSKGIVLMRGEIQDKCPLTMDTAHYLSLALQQFYLTGSPEKHQLVEDFNLRPSEFDFDRLVAEANKLD
ncbi:hypothetical protein IWQ60_005865 [Tieghemiomyces parasiticus]|uniref:ATP11-domain-containing protein n=1 Tax=Tieghemiomyces parasiticus TaxID=78921 RepID=A0A9W8DYH9_9FUNG|nr:hypothetical protein IWQ60_005865 [Tieghemiomyces parasiticus]